MYYVFNGRSTLKTISIPSSVTRISEGNFYRCEGLTSVTLPDSVTEISSAFTQCPSLTAFYSKWASPDKRCLIINGTLWAFAPAGLTKYIIPSGVTLIGYRVFSHCEHLTSITIPDSVISIGAEVFANCTSLTEVTIPAGVTRIGAYAFHYCTSLEGYLQTNHSPNGCTRYYNYIEFVERIRYQCFGSQNLCANSIVRGI